MTAIIHVYFVLPENVNNLEECDSEMQQAFNQCELHRSSAFDAELLTSEECLSKTDFIKTDVIVVHEFKGPVFVKLQKSKATVLGPRCLSCCLMEGSQIPPGPHPIFTIAMKEHVIAISGLSRLDKEKLKTKIQWMGGTYCLTLVDKCTHLISNTVLSEKYSNAVKADITVMHQDWVEAVWEASLKENVLGSDPQFRNHILPPFFELNITASTVSKSEKAKIVKAVNSNGGTYMGNFISETTDIIITNQSGTQSKKYLAGIEYNKFCLLPSWIYDSVKKGAALDCSRYIVCATTTSSPNSSTRLPDMSLNLSTITNLRNPGLGCVDETCSTSGDSTRMTFESAKKNITSSQRSRSSQMNTFNKESAQAVDNIDIKEAKQAGSFLDGCCIYVYGFTTARRDKLLRLVSRAGAIRYDNPHEAVTHALCGDQSAILTLKPSDMPRAKHLRVEWLVDSMKAGKSLDENQYSVQSGDGEKDNEKSPMRPTMSSAANASPMSKRNLQLLQARPPVPLFNLNDPPDEQEDGVPADIVEQYTQTSLTVQDDDDTLMEYVKQSKTAPDVASDKPGTSTCTMKISDETLKPDCNNPEMTDVPEESGTMTDESVSVLFEGMIFEMQGMDKASEEEIMPTMLECGGRVVGKGTEGSTHVVVPLDYDQDDVLNKNAQVVTTMWLSDCMSNQEIMEIKYHHQPVRLIPETSPLAGLTLGISTYESNERLFIDELAKLLGALTQQTFCRRDTSTARASTHLICPTPVGPKYGGAIKWGLPAVTVDWLLACAKKGRRVREGPYLVGDTKEPIWDYEEDPSLKGDMSSTNANDEKENITHNDNSPPLAPMPEEEVAACKTDFANQTRDNDVPKPVVSTPECVTPKGKHGKLSLGGQMSPASRYIAMARQGLLGLDSQETPKRTSEVDRRPNLNETFSTPPMDNALSTPNLALFSPTTRRRMQAIKRGEMPSNPPKTPRNPFDISIATPDSAFGAALRPDTGHMSTESRKKLFKFCDNLPLPNTPDHSQYKHTPIAELKKRFLSQYLNDEGTPLAPRQLHPGDGEETPPSKQRKMSKLQSPSGDQTNGVMSPTLEKKLKQLDAILTGGNSNSTATTPRSILGKRSMGTPSSLRKISLPDSQPVFQSGCGESQMDSVGWDDTTHSMNAATNQQIPAAKVYKFIFSTNVSNRVELETIIKRLGGTVAEEVDSTVTHTVCNKPNRSEKVMASIAAGILLLHPSYISRSQEAGRFLDEDAFVWGSTHPETQVPSVEGHEAIVSLAAQRWHARLRSGHPPAFHGLCVIVHVSPDKRPPLVKLLVLGGAVLLDDTIPPKADSPVPTCCIAELPKRALPSESLRYLASNKIPLCPSTYLAKLLMEDNLEPAMHYAYPDFKKLLDN